MPVGCATSTIGGTLTGDDYHGVLRTSPDPAVLPPYVELVQPRWPGAARRRELARVGCCARRPVSRASAADEPGRAPRRPDSRGCSLAPGERPGPLSRVRVRHASTVRRMGRDRGRVRLVVRPGTDALCQRVHRGSPRRRRRASSNSPRVAAGRDSDLASLFATMADYWDGGYGPLLSAHG